MPCQSDLYFPPEYAAYEARFIPQVKLVPIPSVWGHIAGLGINGPDNEFIDRAHSALQGTTWSIWARNAVRRVVLLYLSNPDIENVLCFILGIPCQFALVMTTVLMKSSKVNQSFLSYPTTGQQF
jgi:hypothetical protein